MEPLFVFEFVFEPIVLELLFCVFDVLFVGGAAGLPELTTISIELFLSISSPGFAVCVITYPFATDELVV